MAPVVIMVFASFTRTGAIIKPVTGVSAKAEIGAEIRAVIGAGLSASAFGNSVSAFGNSVSKCIGYPSAEPYWSRAVPLVIVASRSGDCNNYPLSKVDCPQSTPFLKSSPVLVKKPGGIYVHPSQEKEWLVQLARCCLGPFPPFWQALFCLGITYFL